MKHAKGGLHDVNCETRMCNDNPVQFSRVFLLVVILTGLASARIVIINIGIANETITSRLFENLTLAQYNITNGTLYITLPYPDNETIYANITDIMPTPFYLTYDDLITAFPCAREEIYKLNNTDMRVLNLTGCVNRLVNTSTSSLQVQNADLNNRTYYQSLLISELNRTSCTAMGSENSKLMEGIIWIVVIIGGMYAIRQFMRYTGKPTPHWKVAPPAISKDDVDFKQLSDMARELFKNGGEKK